MFCGLLFMTSREEPRPRVHSYRVPCETASWIGLASHSRAIPSDLVAHVWHRPLECVDESRVEDEQCLI